MHPTSKKVSIQLTKIAGSLSLCTQMLVTLFPDWAGIKKEKWYSNRLAQSHGFNLKIGFEKYITKKLSNSGLPNYTSKI